MKFGGWRATNRGVPVDRLQRMPPPLQEAFTETKVTAIPAVYVVTPTYRRPTQMPDLVRVAQALVLATGVFWVLVEDSNQPTEAANVRLPGVLCFADDDNSYDRCLLDEVSLLVRSLITHENPGTQTVSVFPVGSLLRTGVSSPVVVDGSVVGFHDPAAKGRRFAVDMAGFAINLRLVVNNTHLSMPHREGRQETEFLESLNVSLADLEPLCENATKV
ncbi:galactosylgalactosylxylosylprotein 3-beta-glucuronosyltransferase S-like [Dermacentor silvarum]|uniref:galactosylgalactosylxylosylprotein 3-beta-glucuronosyltransferase S-like n=1 Tax=Dermacentor silvarum TaxID=543639 RepID=UPI00210172F5|nr:galactosylgalactosylxylosylprotein 3-beta-glucuronosyltransferase S-like [Dermacentor silvarum]